MTIRDLARAAEVSETTVSLAFQPQSRITAKTRNKVLAVARRLGYAPNLTARALRVGSPKAVGFVINDITNPFYAFLIRSAEAIALRRGYQVVVADSHWDPARETQAVENMICSRVRGVLICACERTSESLEMLQAYTLPSIVVDTLPVSYRGAFIVNDLVAAGRLAAQHLLEVHCRRLALLTADLTMEAFSAFAELKKGFLEAAARGGVDADSIPVIHAGLTIDGGKLGFRRLWNKAPDVDGIFCANDLCAIGALEAADAQGLRVGPDVAIMGIDDLDISASARISLTTIRQPYQRLVELAVNALIDAIETGEPPDVNMRLKPELIVRDTTRRRRRSS